MFDFKKTNQIEFVWEMRGSFFENCAVRFRFLEHLGLKFQDDGSGALATRREELPLS